MNDYWNDPPEQAEPPECCGEMMEIDSKTGACVCAKCGRRIEPDRDDYKTANPPEDATDSDRMVNFPPKCPHGNEWFACDACNRESDFLYDCWREQPPLCLEHCKQTGKH